MHVLSLGYDFTSLICFYINYRYVSGGGSFICEGNLGLIMDSFNKQNKLSGGYHQAGMRQEKITIKRKLNFSRK